MKKIICYTGCTRKIVKSDFIENVLETIEKIFFTISVQCKRSVISLCESGEFVMNVLKRFVCMVIVCTQAVWSSVSDMETQDLGCDCEWQKFCPMVSKNKEKILEYSTFLLSHYPLCNPESCSDSDREKLFAPVKEQLKSKQELQEQQSHEGAKEAVVSGWSVLIVETHKQQEYIDDMVHIIDTIKRTWAADLDQILLLKERDVLVARSAILSEKKVAVISLKEEIKSLTERMYSAANHSQHKQGPKEAQRRMYEMISDQEEKEEVRYQLPKTPWVRQLFKSNRGFYSPKKQEEQEAMRC